MNVHGKSVFSSEDGNRVLNLGINDAKMYLVNKVKSTKMTAKNRARALGSIEYCKTNLQLSQLVFSWILAHPSEGMKVIK